jgi:hypothetical protein
MKKLIVLLFLAFFCSDLKTVAMLLKIAIFPRIVKIICLIALNKSLVIIAQISQNLITYIVGLLVKERNFRLIFAKKNVVVI